MQMYSIIVNPPVKDKIRGNPIAITIAGIRLILIKVITLHINNSNITFGLL